MAAAQWLRFFYPLLHSTIGAFHLRDCSMSTDPFLGTKYKLRSNFLMSVPAWKMPAWLVIPASSSQAVRNMGLWWLENLIALGHCAAGLCQHIHCSDCNNQVWNHWLMGVEKACEGGGLLVNVKTWLKWNPQFGHKLELKTCLKPSFKLTIYIFFFSTWSDRTFGYG